MTTFESLWRKLFRSKRYREEFVANQVKRGIPFQIRALLKQHGLSQDQLARRAGLSQGVVSRAANPDYGNLTLNTIIRIAAGFDVAFVGKFVPFSELGRWFLEFSHESMRVPSFAEEDKMHGRQGESVPKKPAARHLSGQSFARMTAVNDSDRVYVGRPSHSTPGRAYGPPAPADSVIPISNGVNLNA